MSKLRTKPSGEWLYSSTFQVTMTAASFIALAVGLKVFAGIDILSDMYPKFGNIP